MSGPIPLEKLEELTSQLPDLSLLAGPSSSLGVIEYKTRTGTSLGWSLLNVSEVAIQYNFMSKNTRFMVHTHPSNEWIIIARGSAQFIVDGKEQMILKVGDCQYLPAKSSHSCIALEDTVVIGVTVPAAEGYPDDTGN